MVDDVLLTRRDSGVLTLTLHRPRRKNAINRELWEALREQLTVARDDGDEPASGARTRAVDFATADAPAAFAVFTEKRDPVSTSGWALR